MHLGCKNKEKEGLRGEVDANIKEHEDEAAKLRAVLDANWADLEKSVRCSSLLPFFRCAKLALPVCPSVLLVVSSVLDSKAARQKRGQVRHEWYLRFLIAHFR